jgi:hypothetical protein
MGRVCSKHGDMLNDRKVSSENLKLRDHFGKLSVEGKIILKKKNLKKIG